MPTNLMFCCNAPENGLCQGYAEFVAVYWRDGTVMRCDINRTVIGEKASKLKVGRVQIPYTSHDTWVGNWCWDSWIVEDSEALKVLEYLARYRHLSFEERSVEGMAQIAYLSIEQHLAVGHCN